MTNPEPTIVILRRALAPEDRKPKRVLPGDYFAVIVNSKANRGSVPTITSYFDNSMVPCFGEVPLAYYWRSVPVTAQDCPRELIASLDEVEPVGPIVYRNRLSRAARDQMWKW